MTRTLGLSRADASKLVALLGTLLDSETLSRADFLEALHQRAQLRDLLEAPRFTLDDVKVTGMTPVQVHADLAICVDTTFSTLRHDVHVIQLNEHGQERRRLHICHTVGDAQEWLDDYLVSNDDN